MTKQLKRLNNIASQTGGGTRTRTSASSRAYALTAVPAAATAFSSDSGAAQKITNALQSITPFIVCKTLSHLEMQNWKGAQRPSRPDDKTEMNEVTHLVSDKVR